MPIVLFLCLTVIALTAIVGPTLISSVMPLAYIGAGVFGVKYLMDLRHKHKVAELEKKKEIELLSLQSLQEADRLIDTNSSQDS